MEALLLLLMFVAAGDWEVEPGMSGFGVYNPEYTPFIITACSNAHACRRAVQKTCKPGEEARGGSVARHPGGMYRTCQATCVEKRSGGREVHHIQTIYCFSGLRA